MPCSRPPAPPPLRVFGAIACAAAAASGQAAPSWSPLRPVKLVSVEGATFTPQPDGSIVVAGANPEKDRWTLDFETDLRAITAFRLEALVDPSLPHQGPGRASNGNFVLNELAVEATAKLALRFKPVVLQNATCDFIESHRRAAQVHDGDLLTGGNGWAVHGAVGNSHELVVETKKDVAFEPPVLVRLEMHFNWGSQHLLGRFRVTATDHARPVRAAGAPDEESWPKLQERINHAIDRGVEFLLAKQDLDGSWNHEQWTYRNGATALSTYTLLESGVSRRHPAVLRALEFMRGTPTRETYSLGCQLMALAALDDPDVVPWMTELAETLLGIQRGGFNYPWGGVDLSNTQYGVLGLRAAARCGVKVPPEAFEEAAAQVLRFAKDEGGGAYAPMAFAYNGGAKPTSSMTAAGIGVLAVCDEQLEGKRKTGPVLAAARRGVEWLAANWTVTSNVNETHDRWNTYYLYGVERVGSLLGIEEIGNHEWYREGARRLVDTQGGMGEWSSTYKDHVINTCFALLFLNKATSPASGKGSGRTKLYGGDDPMQAVSLRASGDTPLTIWVSRFGDKEQTDGAWAEDRGRGLRVMRVQYFATGGAYGAVETLLETVEKDGLQPAGRERFGAQCSFPLPGIYRVFARVTVATPMGESVLTSPALEVRIDEAIDPELLEYARDPTRNLLAGQKVGIACSSKLNDGWAPAHAVDNLLCRGWAAENLDPIPTLELELEKPVRATTLLLTPARIDDLYTSRITKIAVTVNGKQPPIVVDVPRTADRRKIRVTLPPAQIVRRLEVKVVQKEECANAEKAVGFAEIELQADKPAGEQP